MSKQYRSSRRKWIGSNGKHVKRFMKQMEVFMMNTCSTTDKTAKQYLFSMFTADHPLFH